MKNLNCGSLNSSLPCRRLISFAKLEWMKRFWLNAYPPQALFAMISEIRVIRKQSQR